MKILIISLAGIGDTIFAGPLIHELRLNFPEAQIEALVRWSGSRQILAGNPHLNCVHQKDLGRVAVGEAMYFLGQLRKRRFDVTINPMPQSRVEYRLVARVIGAPIRISHEYDHFTWLTGVLVNRTLPQDYSLHCAENNLALLKLAGAEPKLERHEYEIFPSDADCQWAENFIVKNGLAGTKLMGIHVGSGGTKNLALRRWPVAYYGELIRQITSAHRDVAVLLLGGPEEEQAHGQLVSSRDGKRVLAPRTENLCQAAALLSHCRLFLSVDTALMHVAAAVKVPGQIVIETPTWNKPIEPYNRPFILVPNPAVAGRNLDFYRYDGRGIRGKPETIVACMESVTVQSVYESVRTALELAGV